MIPVRCPQCYLRCSLGCEPQVLGRQVQLFACTLKSTALQTLAKRHSIKTLQR